MGLAPYGNPEADRVKRWQELILEELVDLREDGSLLLNMDYFDYATGLKMCCDDKWTSLFGVPPRPRESQLDQRHMDLALAIQQVTEEIVLRLADTAKKLTGSANLVMAGGVALNCVANGKLLRQGTFKDIWIQPAAGDAGGALGAALAAWHIVRGQERQLPNPALDNMQGAYLGPEFAADEMVRLARRHQAPHKRYQDYDELAKDVAALLAQGQVVGWFQGRMEFGPRALGNRSILGDPRHPEMQKRLNLKIKYREGFRPFAPVGADGGVQHLLRVGPRLRPICSWWPRCRRRSATPCRRIMKTWRCSTGSTTCARRCRPSPTWTIRPASRRCIKRPTSRYWRLIKAFQELTGCGLIVNTSFNVRGEPIVCTPEDAYQCFMRTEMDYLVLGDFLFDKKEQPQWEEKQDWRQEYELD